MYLLMSAVLPYIPLRAADRFGLSLTAIVLFWVGICYMLLGRKEFGRAHETLVIIGCPLAVVGEIFGIVGGLELAAGGMISATLPPISISAILVGLSLVFLVFHLENTIGKIFLIMGFLAAIGALITAFFVLGAAQVLCPMSMVLTIIAYVIAREEVKRRMLSTLRKGIRKVEIKVGTKRNS